MVNKHTSKNAKSCTVQLQLHNTKDQNERMDSKIQKLRQYSGVQNVRRDASTAVT